MAVLPVYSRAAVLLVIFLSVLMSLFLFMCLFPPFRSKVERDLLNLRALYLLHHNPPDDFWHTRVINTYSLSVKVCKVFRLPVTQTDILDLSVHILWSRCRPFAMQRQYNVITCK